MKFYTQDQNDIEWMHHTERFEGIADTVNRIADAGRWEEFLRLHQDDDGCVDCDGLYDYLMNEPASALKDVGLHYNDATATVADVLQSWEDDNAPKGLKVSRDAGGNPSELSLFECGDRCGGILLDFECVDESGDVGSVSLDEYEVFGLLRSRVTGASNSNKGAWTGTDESEDVFEMWRARE